MSSPQLERESNPRFEHNIAHSGCANYYGFWVRANFTGYATSTFLDIATSHYATIILYLSPKVC